MKNNRCARRRPGAAEARLKVAETPVPADVLWIYMEGMSPKYYCYFQWDRLRRIEGVRVQSRWRQGSSR